MKKLIKSFRFRLFLIILLLGVIGGAVLRVTVVSKYSDYATETKAERLAETAAVLAADVGNATYSGIDVSELLKAGLDKLASAYGGRILLIDSNFTIKYDSFDEYQGKYFSSPDIIECYRGQRVMSIDNDGRFIELLEPVMKDDKVFGMLFISESLRDVDIATENIRRQANIVYGIILVSSVILGLVLSILLALPISRITAQIKAFSDFGDKQTFVSGYTETDQIADAFDNLQVRLKVLDDSRQEFVSNVSHELKTPITSIKVLADSLNEQEDAPVEMYREFMQDIVDELDRENSIITDLLSLVKLDKGVAALNVNKVNVNEMLELIAKRLQPIADSQGIELIFESHKQIWAEIDDVKMTLALTNLIENGIKYNRENGWVDVILDGDHQFMTVVIADSGIGIPDEELDHIFERFYRVEKSHSKEISGTGLGLAIARKTILLHRGSVKVESVPMEGTTFTVRIPLSYIKV